MIHSGLSKHDRCHTAMRGFSGVRDIQLLLLLGATKKHFSGEVCSVLGSDGHHEAEQCSLVLRMIIRERMVCLG